MKYILITFLITIYGLSETSKISSKFPQINDGSYFDPCFESYMQSNLHFNTMNESSPGVYTGLGDTIDFVLNFNGSKDYSLIIDGILIKDKVWLEEANDPFMEGFESGRGLPSSSYSFKFNSHKYFVIYTPNYAGAGIGAEYYIMFLYSLNDRKMWKFYTLSDRPNSFSGNKSQLEFKLSDFGDNYMSDGNDYSLYNLRLNNKLEWDTISRKNFTCNNK